MSRPVITLKAIGTTIRSEKKQRENVLFDEVAAARKVGPATSTGGTNKLIQKHGGKSPKRRLEAVT